LINLRRQVDRGGSSYAADHTLCLRIRISQIVVEAGSVAQEGIGLFRRYG
jgi:hypothetical protein